MRSIPIVVGLLSFGAASPALAQWEGAAAQLGFLLSEVSCRVSTAASAASSSASSGPSRKAECDADSDCHSAYQCTGGQCVAPSYSSSGTQPTPAVNPDKCVRDADCGEGRACSASLCLEQPPVVAAPDASCSSDAQCGAGQVCGAGACIAAPPLPDATSMRRRGSELYLRERAVELREELALGRGPLITGLANAQGVPARELGRTLREHRAELVALIGDGSDTQWSAKFLSRVDTLKSQT